MRLAALLKSIVGLVGLKGYDILVDAEGPPASSPVALVGAGEIPGVIRGDVFDYVL